MTQKEAYIGLWQIIYRFCLGKVKDSYIAEDIVSESFMLLYEKWDSFDSHERSVLISWLFKTAKYKIFDYYRENHITYFEDMEQVIISPEDVSYNKSEEDKLYLKYALEIKKRLSKKDGILFEHIIIAGKNFNEIASIMNTSTMALEAKWYRIKKKIRNFIFEILNVN